MSLKRPKEVLDARLAQHLVSDEPEGIASPERLSLSNFALKLFKALSVS